MLFMLYCKVHGRVASVEVVMDGGHSNGINDAETIIYVAFPNFWLDFSDVDCLFFDLFHT